MWKTAEVEWVAGRENEAHHEHVFVIAYFYFWILIKAFWEMFSFWVYVEH